MCDPTVLALGSAAIKMAGQIGEAAAQNQKSAANKTAAIASQAGQVNDINLRQLQEKQSTAQQLEIAQRQTRTAVSSARLSAGEAGVSGVSVDALLQDLGNEASANAGDIKLNAKMTQDQLDRQKLGIYAQTTDRINSAPPVSGLSTALKIGGTVLGTISDLSGRAPPSDGVTPTSAFTAPSNMRIGSTSNPKFTMPQLRIPYGR